MRLLFDQNLSRWLVNRVADVFPESAHVSSFGLSRALDVDVWEQARMDGFTIVSKDSDFNDLVVLHGFPPYVVWIRRGNCSTDEIAALLHRNREKIEALPESGNGVLELY